uniref:SURF1-like protein n=1 Tax=Hyaloperonospora arabidopsidis (strain Emoy2) TaxID=559515 RepID=M4BIA3_HYAAE
MLGRRLLRVVPRLSTSRFVASVSETAKKKTSGNESSFSRYAGMAAFGAVTAATAYLGTWQVERYYWKVDLIKERTKELSESVIELPKNATASDDTDDIEYRQLRVDGRFKPGSTFYLCNVDDLDPRSAPADPNDSVARVKSGGYIYSLLERENGTPVIVNRGWLPRELLDAHMARDKKEEDVNVSFVGVLRHEEVRNHFTPDNDPENRHFFYVDQRELADAMGVTSTDLPVMVDALAVEGASAEVTLDKPMQKSLASYLEFYMTPEKHVGYAATW